MLAHSYNLIIFRLYIYSFMYLMTACVIYRGTMSHHYWTKTHDILNLMDSSITRNVFFFLTFLFLAVNHQPEWPRKGECQSLSAVSWRHRLQLYRTCTIIRATDFHLSHPLSPFTTIVVYTCSLSPPDMHIHSTFRRGLISWSLGWYYGWDWEILCLFFFLGRGRFCFIHTFPFCS